MTSRKKLIGLVALAAILGCGESSSYSPQSGDAVAIQSIEKVTPEQISASQEVTRKLNINSLFSWSGPQPGEVMSRIQPLTVKADGSVSTGGSFWSRFDSIGSWFTKSIMAIGGVMIGVTLLGTLASLFGANGPLGKLLVGSASLASGPLPIIGPLFQWLRYRQASNAFTEVVDGGDTFRQNLMQLSSLTDAQRQSVWQTFKTSQSASQGTGTMNAVRTYRKG